MKGRCQNQGNAGRECSRSLAPQPGILASIRVPRGKGGKELAEDSSIKHQLCKSVDTRAPGHLLQQLPVTPI